MPHSRAVIRIDHRDAHLLRLSAETWVAQTITTHTNQAHPHRSDVRTDHEYFGTVCDALSGIDEILVTGPHTAQADFRHYVNQHRTALEPHLVAWETVDHPTEGQLAALARTYFQKRDRMGGAASDL
jgi:stalled ribosome rescue protein Dom34